MSTKEPERISKFHVEMDKLSFPAPMRSVINWAKCDMLYTVSHERLELLSVKDENGNRDYISYLVTPGDWKSIQNAVKNALSLG